MEKVSGIGGIFFRADDPDALRDWYKTHLGIDGGDDFWNATGGPTVLAPFARDTGYFGDDSKQFMLNFRVNDMDALIAQLEAAGIPVTTKPEWTTDLGRFARIHDPEGTPIELWQPADELP